MREVELVCYALCLYLGFLTNFFNNVFFKIEGAVAVHRRLEKFLTRKVECL